MEDKFVKEICRPGTTQSCRYLVMDKNGWGCAKLTTMKAYLDSRVAEGTIGAIGDNCEGVPNGEL